MKNTKKKGFTIVELVIVIAVIGILSAILIPTFSGLVQRAQNTALQENLRNAYVEYTSKEAGAGEYLGQDEVYFVVDDVVYEYNSATGEYVPSSETISGTATLELINEAIADDETTEDVNEAVSAEDNSTYNGYIAYKKISA